MKTTLKEIKSFDPCKDGWKKLCQSLGTSDLDTEVSILQILESNGVKDAFWALRTQKYEDYCLILADIAESVLHIFEEKYPKDKRPRKAIQAIKDYKEGKISKEELIVAATAADDADAYVVAVYAARTASAAAGAAYTVVARKTQWKINEEILRKHLGGLK